MGLQEGLYQVFQQHQQQLYDVKYSEAVENGKEKKNSTPFKNSTRRHSLIIPPATQFIYSLWTLPGKNVSGTRKPIRVIIRTLIRLKDSVSKLPVRLRARVEYFPTSVNCNDDASHSHNRSCREIPNSYETSLWILDQVLFGHQVSCLQYRIDPKTCTILGWDVTSIAHAFAVSASDGGHNGSTSRHSGPGPLDHWKALIQLLQSIPAIDMPETLLCLPGLLGEKRLTVNETNRDVSLEGESTATIHNDPQTQQQQIRLDPFSVSVHAPCEDLLAPNTGQLQHAASAQLSSPSSSSAATIGLDDSVLDQAGAVVLGEQALRDCRRDWEWDRPGQVPNTFPVADTTE